MTESPETEAWSPNSWAWNSQAPPPNSGQVRTDSRDWTGAKQLHVDRRNDGGQDVSADLAAIKAGDQVRLEHQTDATRYARYRVDAPATRVGDAYVFPVTYVTGGGTLPNSGTRIVVQLLPAETNTVAWTITRAREPDRYWVTCVCLHGRQSELLATGPGRQPVPPAVVPTTASNLRRNFACSCDQLQPAFAPSAQRLGYDGPTILGYVELAIS